MVILNQIARRHYLGLNLLQELPINLNFRIVLFRGWVLQLVFELPFDFFTEISEPLVSDVTECVGNSQRHADLLMPVENQMVVPFTRSQQINIGGLQFLRLLVVIRGRPEVFPLAN